MVSPTRPLARLVILLLFGIAAGPAGVGQDTDSKISTGFLEDVRRMELDSNVGRREILESILSERGVPYELESFQIEPRENYPRSEGANIVVTLGSGGSDILIGGHYDAVRLRDGTLSPGATDNAASAIILTRLAETLQDEPLRHRVRIVFFDMEEIGLIGSSRYIQTHATDLIDAAINLDVNGYGNTLLFGPRSADGNDRLYRLLKETCLAENIDCQEFARFPSSDGRSFQREGIPNISVSVLPAAETRRLWLSLNSDTEDVFAEGFVPRIYRTIHTPDDTSANVEPAAMELSYRGVLDFVRRLDSDLNQNVTKGNE